MSKRRNETQHVADEFAAELPTDDERLLEAFERELKEANPQALHFQLDWQVGWAVLATVQLACRHEGFTGQARDIAEEFGRKLQAKLTLGPVSSEIAERGWSPGFDVPALRELNESAQS